MKEKETTKSFYNSTIPNDWEVKKIGKMTKTTAGGTPSTSIKEYWGGDIKWMSSGELNFKKIYDVEGRITDVGLKNSSTKLIPAKCILVGLAGQGKTRAQYSRERSLWEEYAFKAAVALTINPYADKLDGIENNKLKQQLIIDSIMNVYSKPKSMYQKENPTSDTLKSILNTVTGDKK